MPNRTARGAAGLAVLIALLPLAMADAARERPPVRIATAEERPVVRELRLTASLTSPRRARIATEVAGRVTAVETETGDAVAAGDALLRLDAELARLELRQAEAAIREAEADLTDARRRLREAENLAERDSISQSELEGRRAEVQRLEAVLARRESERAARAEMVERHVLEAPFDGVINQRLIDLGERADPGAPAFELVATDHLWVDIEVPQQYFGDVTVGTPVETRVDARPDAPVSGRIDRIVPVGDTESRTFLARVDIDNTDGHYIPGMSARATLRIETGRSGVVVPQDALIRYPDGRVIVWIAEGDGEQRTVRERRIDTGLKFNGLVAVRDGLDAGTPVVTEGNEALQDGQAVRVTATE